MTSAVVSTAPRIGARTTFGQPGDLEACYDLLARGSKSFATASKLLPVHVRDASAVLYAFCRVADDAVDLDTDEHRVDRLSARLENVYAGKSLDGAVDRAFFDLVTKYTLPKVIFSALIEGFEWDRTGKVYTTLSDTLAYSARVASTVGVAMTAIMTDRRAHVLARACDLGLAMQLTNIARDVGEDARNGRVYLPGDWLEEEKVDLKAFLRDVKTEPGIERVTLRLLDEADRYYLRAEAGISALPRGVRPAIFAARFIYSDIGRVIRKRGGDGVSSRAVTSKWRKLMNLGRALFASFSAPPPALYEPSANETAFLVNALCTPAERGIAA
ncbi:MAG: phytoene/squalene synthase family protein [Polyangiaceae bacterium]|nr:phytoene/squalene synthase family protein [Polyangiaceae bacterium]